MGLRTRRSIRRADGGFGAAYRGLMLRTLYLWAAGTTPAITRGYLTEHAIGAQRLPVEHHWPWTVDPVIVQRILLAFLREDQRPRRHPASPWSESSVMDLVRITDAGPIAEAVTRVEPGTGSSSDGPRVAGSTAVKCIRLRIPRSLPVHGVHEGGDGDEGRRWAHVTQDLAVDPRDQRGVREYEIDLSQKNAKALRKTFEPWTSSARRVSRGRAATTRGTSTRVETGVDTAAVRAWATSNGIELAARGRLPQDVIEQYRAAGN